jgi:hypothetical protein
MRITTNNTGANTHWISGSGMGLPDNQPSVSDFGRAETRWVHG